MGLRGAGLRAAPSQRRKLGAGRLRVNRKRLRRRLARATLGQGPRALPRAIAADRAYLACWAVSCILAFLLPMTFVHRARASSSTRAAGEREFHGTAAIPPHHARATRSGVHFRSAHMRVPVLLLTIALVPAAAVAAPPPAAKPTQPIPSVAMPGGEAGVGFDDLRYSTTMEKLLVPSGRTGRLNLVDPESLTVVSIPGFSTLKTFNGGHDDGVTSVADGDG